MGAILEYIDERNNNKVRDKLYSFFDSHEGQPDWQERMDAYHWFREENQSRKAGESVDKCLTFDSLGQLLRVTGISGSAFFSLAGLPCEWPGAGFQTVCGLCNSLTPELLERIRESAYALAPDWWRAEEFMESQPSVRARAAFIRILPYDRQREAPKYIKAAAYDNTRSTSIPISEFSGVETRLGINLHWLLRLPPDVPFFGENGIVDEILDAFSFMPDDTKAYFIAGLEKLRAHEEANK